MGRLVGDLPFALRLLTQSPAWTAVVTLSLALGIGANAVVFSVVDAVLLKPFPYADPERLVLLWASKSEQVTRGISRPNLTDWRQQTRTFEKRNAFLGNAMKISLGANAT